MSREWGREAFTPQALAVEPAALGKHMAGMRGGFATREAVTWMKPEDFARGSAGFAPREADEMPGFTPRGVAGVPDPAPAAAPVFAEEEVADTIVEIEEEQPLTSAIDAAEAYAAGFAEGERMAQVAHAADREAMGKLMASLSEGVTHDRPRFARRLQQTVLHLVTQLIGEHGVSADKLAQRIDNAVGLLADVTEPARLHLHPEDLRLLDGNLPTNIAAIADKAIMRGGFRLETMSAAIEDSPAIWLEQLAEALNRTAIPDA